MSTNPDPKDLQVYARDRAKMKPGIDYAVIYSEYHGSDNNVWLEVTLTRFNMDGIQQEIRKQSVPKAEEAAFHRRLGIAGYRKVSGISHKEGNVNFYQRDKQG